MFEANGIGTTDGGSDRGERINSPFLITRYGIFISYPKLKIHIIRNVHRQL